VCECVCVCVCVCLCVFVCVCACAVKYMYTCMYLQDWGQMSKRIAHMNIEQKINVQRIENVREMG